jgi:hypothetical protein
MTVSVYSLGTSDVPVGNRWKKFPCTWNELLHTHGPVHEVKRHSVDRVDLVVVVEVRVERVLHHDELVGVRAALRRVDDEHAVEALGDVPCERRRVRSS